MKVLEIDLVNEKTHCKCNYLDMDKIVITPEGIVISGAVIPLDPVNRNFHTFEKWDGLTEVRLRIADVVELDEDDDRAISALIMMKDHAAASTRKTLTVRK